MMTLARAPSTNKGDPVARKNKKNTSKQMPITIQETNAQKRIPKRHLGIKHFLYYLRRI